MKKVLALIVMIFVLISCKGEKDDYPLEMYSPYTQLSQRYNNYNFENLNVDLSEYYGVFEILKSVSLSGTSYKEKYFKIECIFKDGKRNRTNHIDYVQVNDE